MISTIYPEYPWKPWLFAAQPRHFFKEENNRREFFDWAGKIFEVEKLEDWLNIPKSVKHRRN
jgi:hypothetical protein